MAAEQILHRALVQRHLPCNYGGVNPGGAGLHHLLDLFGWRLAPHYLTCDMAWDRISESACLRSAGRHRSTQRAPKTPADTAPHEPFVQALPRGRDDRSWALRAASEVVSFSSGTLQASGHTG